jgi:phosphoglycerate kinase
VTYRTLDSLDVAGKRVLVRADLNVPMKDGVVTDATRIARQAPTIRELAEKGARVIVLSHFDRPKGKVVPSMSLAPIAEPLAKAVGRPVAFASDCVGEVAAKAVAALKDGDVLLLENTRFHAGEEKNDPALAKEMAALGDIFVNDAFSAAHRAHASTEGVAHLLPSAAGRSMQAELEHLSKALEKPERPLMAVVGGAKVSTKIDLLQNLVKKVDVLVIGGAMANTFLAAQGHNIGKSLAEREQLDTANAILAAAMAAGTAILLPVDAVVAKELAPNTQVRHVNIGDTKSILIAADIDGNTYVNDTLVDKEEVMHAVKEGKLPDPIRDDEMILDVGLFTVARLDARLDHIRTLVWNGPLGAFEIPPFDQGTTAAARMVADLTKQGALISVAGGGDTVAALAHAGVEDAFTYVSTAGGAFLEWLEGRELPGVEALKNK